MSLRNGGANRAVRRALQPGEQVVAVVRHQRRLGRGMAGVVLGAMAALVVAVHIGGAGQDASLLLLVDCGVVLVPLILVGLVSRLPERTGLAADALTGAGVVVLTDRRLLSFSMRRAGHASRLRAALQHGTFTVGRIRTRPMEIDVALAFRDGSETTVRMVEQPGVLIGVVDHLRAVGGAPQR